MEYLREARFPFPKESVRVPEKNDVDLIVLTSSASYEAARARGLERVKDALRSSEVSYIPLTGTSDFNRLTEVLSYPYARLLVSEINDRFLTRRYTLGEAVRMKNLLGDKELQKADVLTVSKELGVKAADSDGELRMHFADYIRFTARIKSQDWKLVNRELNNGYVTLPADRFHRVLQNALHDKLEDELPLNVPDDVKRYIRKDVEHLTVILEDAKKKFSPTGGGDVKLEFFPPCMRTMLASVQNGVNLSHSGRFALVSFLHALGMNSEQILALFSQSPDFDASKSLYQIRHITGELSGGQEYTPPECSTMKSYSICFDPDALCGSEKLNHPLTYYRIKANPRTPAAKD